MILILSIISIIVGLYFSFPYSDGLLFFGLLGLIYDMIKNEDEYLKAKNDLVKSIARIFKG